jgi:hypothetical protein
MHSKLQNCLVAHMNRHEFIAADRKLFERLMHGPLGPITLVLKNGMSVVGEMKGVARGSDSDPVRYWGRILLTVDGEDVEVAYPEIIEFA